MTTYATDEQAGRLIGALGEREREAWNVYREACRDLEGALYDEVEGAAWADLAAALHQIGEERAHLGGAVTSG